MKDAATVGKDLLGRDNFLKVFGEFLVEEIIDIPAFIGEHGQLAR